MNATENIIDILTACGCKPAATVNKNGETVIKVNAPEISAEKSCDTCAQRATCKKDIGVIWGFCNTDYEPGAGV